MAKIKRAMRNNGIPQGGPAYPDLPFFDGPNKDEKPATPATTPNAEVAALQAQIAAMQGQLQTLLPLQATLLQTPAQQPVRPVLKDKIDTSKLPDPIEKPDEFVKALNDEVVGIVRSTRDVDNYDRGQAQSRQEQLQGLWATFQAAHADDGYAADPQKVEIVAEQVIKKMAARKIDTDAYMFKATPQFMADVVSEYDKLFGKPQTGDDNDEPDAGDDAGDDNRTVGVFGGLPSGGKATPAKTAEDSNADMFKGIRDWQTKNGFHS